MQSIDSNMCRRRRAPRGGQRRFAGGFTLVEIMLALGVLAIGMVLVATLFPPAIAQFRRSDFNTLAMVLNENARAVLTARAYEDHDAIAHTGSTYGSYSDYEFTLVPIGPEVDDDKAMIHQFDAVYTPRPGAGWQALVRKLTTDPDDPIYQFVVMPFMLPGSVVGDIHDLDAYCDEIFDPSNAEVGEFYRPYHVADDNDADYEKNVRILQTPLDGCLMLLDEVDFPNPKDLSWLSIGSPVMLDGRHAVSGLIPYDLPFLGRTARIIDIRKWEDNSHYWAVQLSDDLFGAGHRQWSAITDSSNPGVERGVWVFRARGFGANSPALDAYTFTAVLR